MESLGRSVSKSSKEKHENVNVALGIHSPSAKCSREMHSPSAKKHSKEMEESETPISEQPLTPIREKEASKASGPNASPVTPWTVHSAHRVEKPCSGTALEQDEGFTFEPNESGKTVETSGDEASSDASISPSKAGSRRDPRSQSVRCLRFNVSADIIHAPISSNTGQSGSELPRGALIFPPLQLNLGRVLHDEKQPHTESEEHRTNGSLDDGRVSIISKVSDGKCSGTGHYANGSVDREGFSIARVSKGKHSGGTGYSANNGPVEEVRVSVSDALREEAFVEETRISFLGAIVSKQYEDAGLNPSNGEAGGDSSRVPTTPTTPTSPSSRYISVVDSCPGAPLREGARERLPARDLNSVRRKLQF